MNEYNLEWYNRYHRHLEEPGVRRTHDRMFRTFGLFAGSDYLNVIDLGCATQEFYRYAFCFSNYFGIDKQYLVFKDKDSYGNEAKLGMIGDYTKLDLSKVCPFMPDTFISLFSTEIFLSPYKKYEFYERVFQENPTIQVGMVAGVYYKGYEDQYTYIEEDFEIYQTVEDQLDYRSAMFDEFRTYVDVPSEMFGNGVVEVYKFFLRKNSFISRIMY